MAVGAGAGLLVVEGGEEDGLLLIDLEVIYISEVSSWGDPVLGEVGVDELLGDAVDDLAGSAGKAVWDGVDTHVWATEGHDVSDLTRHVALLGDVSGKEATLGETDHVELTGEGLVVGNLLAGLLGDGLEVVDDGSNHWSSNFNALDGGTSSSLDHVVELDVSWLEVEVTETVEHGG